MALRKLPSLESLTGVKAPALPGRTNREGMDGISRNSNQSGSSSLTPSTPSSKEQGSHLNKRDDGGSGTGACQAESGKRDRELSIPAAVNPPTGQTEGSIRQAVTPPPLVDKPENNPFLTGDHILKAIMDKFVELRENQKVGAWKQLQSDLMRAAPFIVPHIIPLKDVIQIAADIEKEIKGSTAQVGRSNEELLSDFLNGGDAIQLKLDNSPINSVVEGRDGEHPLVISPPEIVSPT